MPKGTKKTQTSVSSPHVPISVASQISDADRKLFTAAELEALEHEVTIEAQEDMRAEAKERVRERLRAQKRMEIQRRIDPDEEMFLFTVDLAPFADRIMLDGTIYMHGATYEVPHKQFDTMREIAARTWEHEREIGNANSQFYRKPRSVTLGPKDSATPVTALMRV